MNALSCATSVVLCCHNASATLGRQLGALAAQRTADPWEIVVVDNASTDDTRSMAEAHARHNPRVRVIVEPRLGIARARNAGASQARGSLLLFCDADDEVHDGWIDAYTSNSGCWDLAGGPLDLERLNSCALRRRNHSPTFDELPVALGHLPYATSANLAVHRRVWSALGGFDPRYLRGGTEIEFAWRAQQAGFRLGHVPEAVVAYAHRPTRRGAWRQAFVWGTADVRLHRHFQLPATRTVRRRSTNGRPPPMWAAAYLCGVIHGHVTRH